MTDLLFEMGAPKYQLCIFLALASSQFLWSGKLKKKQSKQTCYSLLLDTILIITLDLRI